MGSLYTNAKVSPSGQVNKQDLRAWGMNMVVFSAPALAVFFGLLANGVALKTAMYSGLLVIYQLAADLFKKFKNK
jgi:hypothetical protein